MKQARVPVDDDEVEPQVCVIEVRDVPPHKGDVCFTPSSPWGLCFRFHVARSVTFTYSEVSRQRWLDVGWLVFYHNGLTLKSDGGRWRGK